MIEFKKIDESKNIVIVTDNESFANASALYTHILRLHKKVSLVCESNDLKLTLSCIPWFDKVRTTIGSSSDLVIDIKEEKNSLYELFKSYNIKINPKMATALYASYITQYDLFSIDSADGMIFASLSELISSGAQYQNCNEMLMKSLPLSLFRLKAIMFTRMILVNEAAVALFHIGKDDFEKSGGSLSEAKFIIKEALNIVHIQRVILLDKDNENELIKLI